MAILNDADVDLAALAGRFEQWLRTQPGYTYARVSSFDQASRANGFSNETYRVALSTPGRAAETLILRLPPARTGLFAIYDLTRQYAFMRLLQAEPGIAIAPCRWLSAETSVFARPFFVTDFVAGDVAGDNPNYVNSGWIVDATAEQRRRLWDGSVEQLVALSRVRLPDAALAQLDWPDRSTPRFVQHVEWWAEHGEWGARQLRGAREPMLDELRRWLLQHVPSEEHAGVVWGDSRFGNMICRDFRPVALLDWELAVVGDPMIDLAYMLFHVFLTQLYHGDERTPERLTGFRGDAQTVAAYCDSSGRTPRDYRTYWLFNAYKMLAIWQCKAALMLRSGAWSEDQAESARHGTKLLPHIATLLSSGQEEAYMR